MEEKIYPSEKVYYYKLIRDLLPQRMTERGATFEVEELDDARYEVELYKKLVEEAQEVMTATSREEMVCELGNLLDVIDEVRRLKDVHDDELMASRAEQMQKKGGFTKRLLLLWSENP